MWQDVFAMPQNLTIITVYIITQYNNFSNYMLLHRETAYFKLVNKPAQKGWSIYILVYKSRLNPVLRFMASSLERGLSSPEPILISIGCNRKKLEARIFETGRLQFCMLLEIDQIFKSGVIPILDSVTINRNM